MYDLVVVGGGAAGFFSAINFLEKNPHKSVLILEQGSTVLGKVRISGGGRCNVTNGRLDPKELQKFYPRGAKELLGQFYRFGPEETVQWFKSRGLDLYEQSDRRMFPQSDSSQSVIDLFLSLYETLGGELLLSTSVRSIKYFPEFDTSRSAEIFPRKHPSFSDGAHFCLTLKKTDKLLYAKKVLFATGSHPSGYRCLESLGHTIQPPIPSIFTFCMPESLFLDLAGLSHQNVQVRMTHEAFTSKESKMTSQGAILATHWGVSGPAVLALSAYLAKALHRTGYCGHLHIDWFPKRHQKEIEKMLESSGSFTVEKAGKELFLFSKRLWSSLVHDLLPHLDLKKRLDQVSKKDKTALISLLKHSKHAVKGKSTFKEEFVTCGGVDLKEVDMVSMQSKKVPGLFFSGELLDIDGVTGGFNFQAAWTTAWHAAQAM